MIQINLLPEELRKKRGPSLEINLESQKVKILLGSGILAGLILIFLLLLTGSYIRKSQVSALLNKEKKFASSLSQVEKINKEMAILNVKMRALDELTKRKFLWAQKLNQISDSMLAGTWLTRLYVDAAENKLILEGSVVSKSEDEMASVGKLMKNIKDDEKLFKDFRNIKLESVQRRSQDSRDVVDFKITLYFL